MTVVQRKNPFELIPDERMKEFIEEVESAYLFEVEDLGDNYFKRLPSFFDFLTSDSFDDYIEELVNELHATVAFKKLKNQSSLDYPEYEDLEKELIRGLVAKDGQLVLDMFFLSNVNLQEKMMFIPVQEVW